MLNQLKTLRALTPAEQQAITDAERQYNLFLATIWRLEAEFSCNSKELDKAKASLKETLLSTVRSIVLALRK